MQNPESLSKTKGLPAAGFASGFPEILSVKHFIHYMIEHKLPGE
jgi:hypothetical protein